MTADIEATSSKDSVPSQAQVVIIGGGVIGCCEHMSDKQNRYAHVRLIESHDARVVVH